MLNYTCKHDLPISQELKNEWKKLVGTRKLSSRYMNSELRKTFERVLEEARTEYAKSQQKDVSKGTKKVQKNNVKDASTDNLESMHITDEWEDSAQGEVFGGG